jgi:hypothetical protein
MSADSGPSWTSPPVAAAAAQPPPKPLAINRIAYLESLRFVFTHPDWLKNTVMGGLCLLIPVLNQLIALGYAYEITELLHRRKTASYPLFEFNHFVRYITRGVWPFLISFIVQTVLQPVLQITIQGSTFGLLAIAEADETAGTIAAIIVIPLLVIGLFGLTVGLVLVLTPMMLRAGLSQDFGQVFKFGWIKDFVKRMWVESILVNLFVILLSMLLVPLGCVFFCFPGLMVAMGLSIAGAHLNWQLYELYLARGGEPIPLKPLPGDVPPVVTGP